MLDTSNAIATNQMRERASTPDLLDPPGIAAPVALRIRNQLIKILVDELL